MNKLCAKRQLTALRELPGAALKALRALLSRHWMQGAAFALTAAQLLGAAIFGTPVTPYKDEIDMTQFELVWSDEFDHGFDTTTWQGHYVYGANDTQKRDTAYWNREQVSFDDDGCLHIRTEFRDGPAGEQYYSYGMETNPNNRYESGYRGYEQLYGYFETRCIFPKGPGLCPAFWLLTNGMWDDDTDGGLSGCEIDVFETPYEYNRFSPFFNSVFQTLHVDGYEEAHKREAQGDYYCKDPYDQFNTYGVAWNPDGYIFYINGVETARTDFGGVCQAPLYLILSVGVNELIADNKDLPADFVVDYVRAYQYKSVLENEEA